MKNLLKRKVPWLVAIFSVMFFNTSFARYCDDLDIFIVNDTNNPRVGISYSINQQEYIKWDKQTTTARIHTMTNEGFQRDVTTDLVIKAEDGQIIFDGKISKELCGQRYGTGWPGRIGVNNTVESDEYSVTDADKNDNCNAYVECKSSDPGFVRLKITNSTNLKGRSR